MPVIDLSKVTASLLAQLICATRDDWNYPGVMAALHSIGDLGLVEVTLTAMTCAADPSAQTPAAMRSPYYRSGWQPDNDPAHAARLRTEEIANRRKLDQLHADVAAAEAAREARAQRVAP